MIFSLTWCLMFKKKKERDSIDDRGSVFLLIDRFTVRQRSTT